MSWLAWHLQQIKTADSARMVQMATILVVEDDRDTLEGLSKLLEVNGYRAVQASNGWEALLALDKTTVDLVICDLNMPGMTGETFVKILHNDRHRSSMPVLILTARDFDDPTAKAHELGVEGWFVKSKYHDSTLLMAVQRELDTSGAAQSSIPGKGNYH